MSPDLQCWDCYAMRALAGIGILGACSRHATPEQREAANQSIRELALRENPMLTAMRRR